MILVAIVLGLVGLVLFSVRSFFKIKSDDDIHSTHSYSLGYNLARIGYMLCFTGTLVTFFLYLK